MNTKDLVLLGALGFGAYYMMTRPAVARVAPVNTLAGSKTAANVNAFANLANSLKGIFTTGGSGSGTFSGVTLGNSGTSPYFDYGDMFAINPVNSYTLDGLGGDNNYLGTGSYL